MDVFSFTRARRQCPWPEGDDLPGRFASGNRRMSPPLGREERRIQILSRAQWPSGFGGWSGCAAPQGYRRHEAIQMVSPVLPVRKTEARQVAVFPASCRTGHRTRRRSPSGHLEDRLTRRPERPCQNGQRRQVVRGSGDTAAQRRAPRPTTGQLAGGLGDPRGAPSPVGAHGRDPRQSFAGPGRRLPRLHGPSRATGAPFRSFGNPVRPPLVAKGRASFWHEE